MWYPSVYPLIALPEPPPPPSYPSEMAPTVTDGATILLAKLENGPRCKPIRHGWPHQMLGERRAAEWVGGAELAEGGSGYTKMQQWTKCEFISLLEQTHSAADRCSGGCLVSCNIGPLKRLPHTLTVVDLPFNRWAKGNKRVTQGLNEESRSGDKEEMEAERKHQNKCENNKEAGVHFKWSTWVCVSAWGETTQSESVKENMLIADDFLWLLLK